MLWDIKDAIPKAAASKYIWLLGNLKKIVTFGFPLFHVDNCNIIECKQSNESFFWNYILILQKENTWYSFNIKQMKTNPGKNAMITMTTKTWKSNSFCCINITAYKQDAGLSQNHWNKYMQYHWEYMYRSAQ